MDARLVTWARAVKARDAGGLPPLWLLTDAVRLAAPAAAVAALPRGLAGVVLRHDASPGRVALAHALAAICRRRRLLLAVAGDWRLAAAVGAGLHLREGRLPGPVPRWLPRLTASAHGRLGAIRAMRAGAGVVLLSPVFPTASHPGAGVLGPLRWRLVWRGLALRHRRVRRGALGGVSGARIGGLGRVCTAIGAIGALAPDVP